MDGITRKGATNPEATAYEAQFTQSEAKSVTASAKKFAEKAAVVLDLTSQ